MDAKELMIGDWVKISYNGEVGQVYRIDMANGKGNEFAAVNGCDRSCENLVPIPLTSEILKKNGWNRYDALCSGNGCTISVWSEDLYYFSCSKTHNDTPSELISCHIHYVHELQHALRLAGIKKEIVL